MFELNEVDVSETRRVQLQRELEYLLLAMVLNTNMNSEAVELRRRA